MKETINRLAYWVTLTLGVILMNKNPQQMTFRLGKIDEYSNVVLFI